MPPNCILSITDVYIMMKDNSKNNLSLKCNTNQQIWIHLYIKSRQPPWFYNTHWVHYWLCLVGPEDLLKMNDCLLTKHYLSLVYIQSWLFSCRLMARLSWTSRPFCWATLKDQTRRREHLLDQMKKILISVCLWP